MKPRHLAYAAAATAVCHIFIVVLLLMIIAFIVMSIARAVINNIEN